MKAKSSPRHIWRWVRHASATHEDAWRERLAFLGGANLVVHTRPGTKMIRLEAYDTTAAPLRRVARDFGGKVDRLDAEKLVARANAPRHPLRLARDFAVMDAHGTWPAKDKRPRILLRIGGAMAFGTGEHATTAACLRFVRDEAARLGEGWPMLDIGTGTGILAIAAEKLGAARVIAFDYDPRAIKAAEANAKRNRCRRVKFSLADLLAWKPGKTRYPLVAANVFSEILRAAAPQITDAVQPGGCLVLSGILRVQEKETLATFVARKLQLEKTSRRGKWVTLQLRKAD
jgi:ribosomal protein L11 methyltransferase